jgi:hypothetical protein
LIEVGKFRKAAAAAMNLKNHDRDSLAFEAPQHGGASKQDQYSGSDMATSTAAIKRTTNHRQPLAGRTHEPPPRAVGEMWEDGVDKADETWDAYDCELRAAVIEYNRHLAGSPSYFPLDWKVVKAMLWVETGARSPKWRTRPMQIGNDGDPGLQSLLLGNEGGDLIVPPSMRPYLSIDGVKRQPTQNIRAGIGYLLMRMAKFGFKSIPDADARIHEVTAAPGDSLDRIAKAQGSTLDVMRKLNPSVNIVHAGDVLRYQKASIQRVITGWGSLSAGSIALRYNSGDPQYAKKFQYAAQAITQRTEAACAR